MPAPHRAARTAAVTDTAALSTGTGACPAGDERRVPVELAQLLAAQHGHQSGELRLEAIDGIGLADAGHLEVQGQGAGGHAEPDPAAMAGLEPGDLLGDERRGTQGKQQRRRGGPPRRSLRQDEGGHLQGLRHVAGEAAVVLARHDAVEAVVEGEGGLRAELADDGVGGQLVVRVQPEETDPGPNGADVVRVSVGPVRGAASDVLRAPAGIRRSYELRIRRGAGGAEAARPTPRRQSRCPAAPA